MGKLLFILPAIVISYLIPPPVHAVNCDNTGEFTSLTFSPAELNQESRTMRVSADFRYKTLTQEQLGCFSETVRVRFFLIGTNGDRLTTFGDVTIGTVAQGQVKNAQNNLTYDTVRQYFQSSQQARVHVEAYHGIFDGGDRLGNRTGTFSYVHELRSTYGCTAPNGVIACGTRSDCSDAVGCVNPAQSCRIITDARLCGQTPTPTSSLGPSGSGRPITYTFKIDNPLGGASDLMGLIRAISQWIFNISIPVAVIFIIYGGLQFLLAGANPAMAAKGKQTLKYAVLGLAILMIGYGFVTLIESIIKLGDANPSSSPRPTQSVSPRP